MKGIHGIWQWGRNYITGFLKELPKQTIKLRLFLLVKWQPPPLGIP